MAGVSAGTVDRVLHNRGEVSQSSREKVEAILTEIDYKPNLYVDRRQTGDFDRRRAAFVFGGRLLGADRKGNPPCGLRVFQYPVESQVSLLRPVRSLFLPRNL